MKITLITACRNAIATIRDAVASVAAQRSPVEIEHIVVDGGSTDGTVEFLHACAEKASALGGADGRAFTFRWISEPDNGMYDAINKGIRMATGDVIGILNADDVLDGDQVVARIAREFGGGERIDCLFGNVRFVRSPCSTSSSYLRLVQARTSRVCFARWWRPWMLQWGYMPPHPAIFIRRACFETWGGYIGDRKEYLIAADYELLIRFFRVHRMTHRYMKVCTTVMRPGGLSTANVDARRRLNAEIIKGNRANGYFCCWPMLLPKYCVKIWEVILPRLGLMRWRK